VIKTVGFTLGGCAPSSQSRRPQRFKYSLVCPLLVLPGKFLAMYRITRGLVLTRQCESQESLHLRRIDVLDSPLIPT